MSKNVDINLENGKTWHGLAVAGCVLTAWAIAVAASAEMGVLKLIPPPAIAALVALGIAAPVAAYLSLPSARRFIDGLGLYPLTVFHIWRVPAGLVFFAYGFGGALPPLFWILAGSGDLLVGLYAFRTFRARDDIRFFSRFHLVGFADFIVAVGTGLTFTLLGDPRMDAIAELPMALIPLFGVGVSGASHIIAFMILRRMRRTPFNAVRRRA